MDGPDLVAETLPAETRAMLERSLAHAHAVVRLKAVEAAARLQSAAVLPLLAPVFGDTDSRIRSATMELFVRVASSASATLARQFFDALSEEEQARFTTRLGARNDAESQHILEQLLASESNPVIQALIIRSLRTTDDIETQRRILEALVSEYNDLRQSADALVRANARWLAAAGATQALPVLEKARAHSYPELQHNAVVWTDRIHAAQIRRVMLNSGVAPAMAITSALRSSHALLRESAAEMCATRRDERCVPALIEALHDPVSSVRRAAAVALVSSEWVAETEQEHAAALVALGRFREALEFGDAGINALIASTRDSDPDVQAKAAAHLAQSGRAMPALATMLNSLHRQVRAAAARALKTMDWYPPTPAQAVAQAVALDDWKAVAEIGAAAVPALIAELKSESPDRPDSEQIAEALSSINDPDAAASLLAACRDGEVAAAAVNALNELLQKTAGEISQPVLQELARLEDVVQFKFAIDPAYKRRVRTSFEMISTESVRALAAEALGNRAAFPT
jgi:HEAT repeat protein